MPSSKALEERVSFTQKNKRLVPETAFILVYITIPKTHLCRKYVLGHRPETTNSLIIEFYGIIMGPIHATRKRDLLFVQ
jgi:hypothetical protein